MTNKQDVEVKVIVTLNYKGQCSEPIQGTLEPSRETITRDLHTTLKDKGFYYEERRTNTKEIDTINTNYPQRYDPR